jgi:hypothetical protein
MYSTVLFFENNQIIEDDLYKRVKTIYKKKETVVYNINYSLL